MSDLQNFPPTEAELLPVIRTLRDEHPTIGIAKIGIALKSAHPSWALRLNHKRIRAAVRELEKEQESSQTSLSKHRNGEEDNGERVSSPTVGNSDSGAEESDTLKRSSPFKNNKKRRSQKVVQKAIGERDRIKGKSKDSPIELRIKEIRRYMAHGIKPRPPTARFHSRTNPSESLDLLSMVKKKSGCMGFICLPDELEELAALGGKFRTPGIDGYRLFYAEWDCYMGPDPDEPMGLANPFTPHIEAMNFAMLFPDGIGQYLGPTGYRTPLTFERYATNRLQNMDERFQMHREWLFWVLTRTEDRGLAKAVNCCLVNLHKCKARHLGKGNVQVLDIGRDFETCELRDGVLEAVGTPVGETSHKKL